MEYIFTFQNTHEAIFAEKILLQHNINVRVMSLPTQIAAGCGICLRVSPQQFTVSFKIMQQHDIPVAAVYTACKKETGTEYLKWIK